MDNGTSDVHKVLTFGREKLARQKILFGLFVALVGMLGVLFADDSDRSRIVSWLLLAGGIAWTAYEFSKVTLPQKPLLVLSPEGIRLRVEDVKEFLIPWTEVRGVDAITVSGPRRATFDNVTAVLVSRAFYDKEIHVDSFLRRGPGWDLMFIPSDSMIQVALHHAILPVEAPDLLAAVEARYRAFGRGSEPTKRA